MGMNNDINNFKKFLLELFSDDNNLNEKSVVGFISFTMMIITLIADITTGLFGKDLPIHEFVFQGFLIITLGAFGIASVDKYINKNTNKDDETTTE